MQITDVNTLFGGYPSRHSDSTAETLVATMGANQVDYTLTLSTLGIFYNDRAGNEETMAACRKIGGLVPVATIDPRGFWGQALDAYGVGYEMFRFFPHDQGWSFESVAFRQIVGALAAGPATPIMISVRTPGDASRIAEATAGYPKPVILEGVAPDTLSEAIAIMRQNDRIYLETHAFASPGALLVLRDTVGVDRVLFGSRAPGLSLGAAMRYIHGSGLTEAEQVKVLAGNAGTVWHGGAE